MRKTRPGESTFALLSIPTAYSDRPIVDFWQSALADRVMDTMQIANWRFDIRANWPARRLRGLRFRLTDPSPLEWDVSEVRLYSEAGRFPRSPRWLPGAWPNRWEAPLAFDDSFATRWRTWDPVRSGMFLEVLFDQPERLTSAVLASRAPAFGKTPVDFYGLREDGQWELLCRNPKPVVQSQEYPRRPAIAYLKSSGIDYILAPTDFAGIWQLGKILVEQQSEWGLSDVGQSGSVHLLRIESFH